MILLVLVVVRREEATTGHHRDLVCFIASRTRNSPVLVPASLAHLGVLNLSRDLTVKDVHQTGQEQKAYSKFFIVLFVLNRPLQEVSIHFIVVQVDTGAFIGQHVAEEPSHFLRIVDCVHGHSELETDKEAATVLNDVVKVGIDNDALFARLLDSERVPQCELCQCL